MRNDLAPNLFFVGGGLLLPSGVTTDAAGDFYAAAEPRQQVIEYTQPVILGTATLQNLKIGPGSVNPSAGSLRFPMGLPVDSFNRLYVADSANNRVEVFNEGLPPTNPLANGTAGQIDQTSRAR